MIKKNSALYESIVNKIKDNMPSLLENALDGMMTEEVTDDELIQTALDPDIMDYTPMPGKQTVVACKENIYVFEAIIAKQFEITAYIDFQNGNVDHNITIIKNTDGMRENITDALDDETLEIITSFIDDLGFSNL